MGAATSQSAILGNIVVKDSGHTNVVQKDRKRGTDNDFHSILESMTGTMMMPAGMQVLRPDTGSKKGAQHIDVSSVKQTKVGLPYSSVKLATILDPKSVASGETGKRPEGTKDLESDGAKRMPGSGSGAQQGKTPANSQLGPIQPLNVVEIQGREMPKLSTNANTAKPEQALFSPFQVQVAPNSQGSVSEPDISGIGMLQPAQLSNLNSPAGLNVSRHAAAHANMANIKAQAFVSYLGDQQNQLPVAKKMVLDANQTGSGLDKKSLSANDEQRGNDFGLNFVHTAAEHLQSLQPVHPQTQSGHNVNNLDVSQPNWMNSFGQIVGHASQDNGGTIQVKVHPEGMGDLLISVSQTTAGLQIHVEANQLSTAQWLGQQTGQMTNAVSQLGISVANVQVGFGQANLSQSGNGQSNRKSGDGEKQARSVTGSDERSSLVTDESTSGVNMPVYNRGGSISLHA